MQGQTKKVNLQIHWVTNTLEQTVKVILKEVPGKGRLFQQLSSTPIQQIIQATNSWKRKSQQIKPKEECMFYFTSTYELSSLTTYFLRSVDAQAKTIYTRYIVNVHVKPNWKAM